jgi:hypothetical protein
MAVWLKVRVEKRVVSEVYVKAGDDVRRHAYDLGGDPKELLLKSELTMRLDGALSDCEEAAGFECGEASYAFRTATVVTPEEAAGFLHLDLTEDG